MRVSLRELTRISARIGCLSFGGPAAQIALMHKEIVEDRPWLSEAQFLRALSFCMLLPGPEAMQLATYVGWKLRGVPGGLIAGALFVIPGALVIFALALIYAHLGTVPLIQALFLGIKATVVIIVIQALIKVSKRALISRLHLLIAALAFAGLFLFNLPFPLIIVAAALIGAVFSKAKPAEPATAINPWHTLRVFAIGGALWAVPFAFLGDNTFLWTVGLFFSQLAVVTFGGAYAVLAYMTQTVVQDLGWLSTPQMIDALGLAETTPGPLILVTQFVGFTAGHSLGGLPLALAAGALTLWVTFVPCFIWIFAGAPYIDWLASRPRLSSALAAITAAVVGVIANLSLWFAAHVLFNRVTTTQGWGLSLLTPDLSSLNLSALVLGLLAAFLLLLRGWPLPRTLLLMAIAGAVLGSL